jgi:hypothetical protein
MKQAVLPAEGAVRRAAREETPLARTWSDFTESKSAVICRDNTTTVGAYHGATGSGVEFLEGALPGIKKFLICRMKMSWRRRIYIDSEFISRD